MLDEHSVITHATRGFVERLAEIREVTPRRMYEQLGDQCCYAKSKLLIRDIAKINPAGARLIKADMDALWNDILGEDRAAEPTAVEIHRECFEAIDALLDNKPLARQEKEIREVIEICERKLSGLERKLKAVER